MDSQRGIKQVILYDECDYDETPPEEDLELCISKTDKVYYNKTKDTTLSFDQSVLQLRNYVGQIFVPSITGITVINTYRDITGIIASPAILNGQGSMNLVIEKNKGLELCLLSTDTVRINKKIIYHESGILEKPQVGQIGIDFDYFKFNYIEYISKNTPSHVIEEENMWKRANFEKSKFKVKDIDVCMYYSLVLINKTRGSCNLVYAKPKTDTKEGCELQASKAAYNRLHRESKFAECRGEYETVAKLQTEMDIVEKEIKKLDIVVRRSKKSLSIKNPATPNKNPDNFDKESQQKNGNRDSNVSSSDNSVSDNNN